MIEINSFAADTWRDGLGLLYLPDAGAGGAAWKDYSGNGNDATLLNSANFTNATGFNSRRVLELNAVGRAAVPFDSSLGCGTPNVSVAAWIYVRNAPLSGPQYLAAILSNHFSSIGSVEFRLGWGDNARKMRPALVFYTGSFTSRTSNTDVPLNQWTFIAITSGDGQARFYHDGELVDSQAWSSTPNVGSAPFNVGQDSGRIFDGSIGMLGFWPQRTVSAEEIKSLYEATK